MHDNDWCNRNVLQTLLAYLKIKTPLEKKMQATLTLRVEIKKNLLKYFLQTTEGKEQQQQQLKVKYILSSKNISTGRKGKRPQLYWVMTWIKAFYLRWLT